MGKELYFSEALQHTMNRILDYPLTVIEADSGYGKTTAVTGYLFAVTAGIYEQHLYTCLGESADRSWQGFCRMLQSIDEDAAGYLSVLGAPDTDTFSDIAHQMRHLICETPTILCLDNFHLLKTGEKSKLIYALSQHRTPNLHIIILTQPETDTFYSPDSKILCITAEAFAFSKNDIQLYFRREQAALSHADLDFVLKTSEGLAAAVALQMDSWKYRGKFEPTGKISRLMEFALWKRLAFPEQEALLFLSVMDSFTLKQGVGICSPLISPEQLELLLQHTSFIRFQEENGRYFFHHLLHVYLSEKFQLLKKEKQRQIWECAAAACAEEGDYLQAAFFYGKTGNYDSLLSLPIPIAERKDLVRMQNYAIAEALLLPEHREQLTAHPQVALYFAFELLLQGNFTLFSQYFSLLQNLLPQKDRYDPEAFRQLSGELALLQSFLAFNDVEKMCAYHQQADLLMDKPTGMFSLHAAWTFGAPSIVYLFWRRPGELEKTQQMIKAKMPVYCRLAHGNGTGAAETMEAELLLLKGSLQQAMSAFQQAAFEAELLHQDCICCCVYLGMARLALLRGDSASFTHMLENLSDTAYHGTEQCRVFMKDICEAYLYLLLEEYEKVPEWICQEDAVRRRSMFFAVPFVHMIFGRMLLYHHRLQRLSADRCEEILQSLLSECRNFHMLLPELHYRIYLAILQERCGQHSPAIQNLHCALELAAADLVLLPLAEHYSELQALLDSMIVPQSQRGLFQQIRELGECFLSGRQEILKLMHPPTNRLSTRERQVACLLKQRYSVKEIAQKLCISPSTVSNTMQKVYSKLGIHSKKELYSRNDLDIAP